ncbi:MAG: hypothetical protein JWM41_2071 [Gemmatimonadetes bacterium]|nr:hypothetical protein [Gemmatimonadota bacterium]
MSVARVLRSRAYLTFGVVWCGSVVALLIADRANAVLALATAAYALLLAGGVIRFLPPPRDARTDDVFRAQGPRRSVLAQNLVGMLAFGWAVLTGFVYGGRFVPFVTPTVVWLQTIHTPLKHGAGSFFNFAGMALVPGLLLFAVGARPRHLGLRRPERGTLRAATVCLALPLTMCIFALVNGGIKPVTLLWLLVYNFFSNGFSEEFQSRAINLSQLRAWMANDWALVIQAILFAVPHIGSTIHEYHSVAMALANVVALNAPIAMALGIMALRSRSLVLPTVVHISLDTMAALVGAP